MKLDLTEDQEAICSGQITKVEFSPVCKQAGGFTEGTRLCETTGEKCHRLVGMKFVFPDGESVINSDGTFPKQESDL